MLNNSYGIISFNKDNFNLYINSNYILVKFLINKVLTYITNNLINKA